MLSTQDKVEIVLLCGENVPYRDVAYIFNRRHPGRNIHFSTVGRILKTFKETGSVDNRFKKPHNPIKYNEEEQLNVCLSVVENGKTNIRSISEDTGVGRETVRRILHKNKFHPYKPKFIHTLKARDFDIRVGFSFWFQGERENDIAFPYRILWTDEATFTSNGTVSSQNCRWWSNTNPNFVIECRDQYSFKTNVWCGLLHNQIIGPYFFRENLNAAMYRNFIMNQLSEVLDNLPLSVRRNLWYQLDGAPIHQTVEVKQCLSQMFRGKVIGRDWEDYWPPRSPDLSPMDFFLWGYLKQKVYKHGPFANKEHLENTIRECCYNINPLFIKNATKSVNERTIICIEREGRHTE